MNYVVWESVAHFKRGYELPEFQAQLKSYPASRTDAELTAVVADTAGILKLHEISSG
jgi:hypothetical protein